MQGEAPLPETARYTEADARRFSVLFMELVIERVEAAIREHEQRNGAGLRELR